MADIISFPKDEGYNTGYKYFAKAVLESLWSDESEDARICIVDRTGKKHEIVGAEAAEGVVTIFI